MNTDKDLSDEQMQRLDQIVHKQMVIADSTSGHEPQPIIEKTLKEQKKFVLQCTDRFYFHLGK